MKKYCSNCGKETDENDKFCGYCGNEIKIEQLEEMGEFLIEERIEIVLAKISGALLLCVGILGLFFGILLTVHGVIGETWSWYYQNFNLIQILPSEPIFMGLWGIIMISISALPLMGGLDTIRLNNWKTGLAGCIGGIFLIGPGFLLAVISVVSLFLIAFTHESFES